jgi:hypothetical protein
MEARENYIMRSFTIFTPRFVGDLIKGNETGRACDMFGKGNECIQRFGGGYLKEGDYW